MFKKLFVSLAIKFGLRAWLKFFSGGVKWDLVKQNLAERIRKLLPGDLVDDEAVLVMEKTIEVIQGIVASAEFMEKAVELVKEGKTKELLALLKQSILDKYLPNRDLAMNEDESLLMAIQAA